MDIAGGIIYWRMGNLVVAILVKRVTSLSLATMTIVS